MKVPVTWVTAVSTITAPPQFEDCWSARQSEGLVRWFIPVRRVRGVERALSGEAMAAFANTRAPAAVAVNFILTVGG